MFADPRVDVVAETPVPLKSAKVEFELSADTAVPDAAMSLAPVANLK